MADPATDKAPFRRARTEGGTSAVLERMRAKAQESRRKLAEDLDAIKISPETRLVEASPAPSRLTNELSRYDHASGIEEDVDTDQCALQLP